MIYWYLMKYYIVYNEIYFLSCCHTSRAWNQMTEQRTRSALPFWSRGDPTSLIVCASRPERSGKQSELHKMSQVRFKVGGTDRYCPYLSMGGRDPFLCKASWSCRIRLMSNSNLVYFKWSIYSLGGCFRLWQCERLGVKLGHHPRCFPGLRLGRASELPNTL